MSYLDNVFVSCEKRSHFIVIFIQRDGYGTSGFAIVFLARATAGLPKHRRVKYICRVKIYLQLKNFLKAGFKMSVGLTSLGLKEFQRLHFRYLVQLQLVRLLVLPLLPLLLLLLLLLVFLVRVVLLVSLLLILNNLVLVSSLVLHLPI